MYNYKVFYVKYKNKKMRVLIDYKDYYKISKTNWYWSERYVRGVVNKKRVYLHRFILNIHNNNYKDGECDHINGNTRDNRKINLRICTHSQNSINRKIRVDSKTKIQGVYKIPSGYRLSLSSNGIRKHKGVYKTLKEAKHAREKFGKNLQGEFFKY
jgi:hypothetical protein